MQGGYKTALSALTLRPTFIQRKQDSGFEFCRSYNDPAESAQSKPLIYMPERAFDVQTGLAVTLLEKVFQPGHLRVAQPV